MSTQKPLEQCFEAHKALFGKLRIQDPAFGEVCSDHELLRQDLLNLKAHAIDPQNQLLQDVIESLRALEKEAVSILSVHLEASEPINTVASNTKLNPENR